MRECWHSQLRSKNFPAWSVHPQSRPTLHSDGKRTCPPAGSSIHQSFWPGESLQIFCQSWIYSIYRKLCSQAWCPTGMTFNVLFVVDIGFGAVILAIIRVAGCATNPAELGQTDK